MTRDAKAKRVPDNGAAIREALSTAYPVNTGLAETGRDAFERPVPQAYHTRYSLGFGNVIPGGKTMSAPAIMGMRSSTREWPNAIPSKLGRQAKGIIVWAKPNPINRVRYQGNGRKILVNRGEVILRGSR
jgi:hypothetical protein